MKWGNSMQEFAKILSNVEIAKDIWKMELKTDLAKIAKPGQFIESQFQVSICEDPSRLVKLRKIFWSLSTRCLVKVL